MKKVFIWIVFALLIFSLCSCAKKDTDIDNYEEVVQEYKASAFMPELDEVGVYENIEYLSRYDHSFFPIDTIQLIVEYDEENFLKEKERLDTAYTYLDKPQLDEANDDFYTIPVERFSTAGFDFRVAVFEDSDFPEEFQKKNVKLLICGYTVPILTIFVQRMQIDMKKCANSLKRILTWNERWMTVTHGR